jgi:hypothetical protein
MGYEVKEARTYPGAPDAVRAAAAEVAAALGAKPAKKVPEGTVDVVFNKGVGAKVLMNRVELQLRFAEAAPGQCAATAEAFPVDPVGQKLLFGVMGQPARDVAAAFWAALDAKLGRPPG